jgi:hypothetical protein
MTHAQTPASPLINDNPIKNGKLRPTSNGCVEYTGCADRKGYGLITINRKLRRAPRFVWESLNGSIPEGMVIMHTCDNPPCVNPEHLRCGTQKENIADMVAKGRRPKERPPMRAAQKQKLSEFQKARFANGTNPLIGNRVWERKQ